MKKILQTLLVLATIQIKAQCGFVDNAVTSGDTLHCDGGDGYRTAVAYHPGFNLYYSVNAGGTTPEEVFDANGLKLQTLAGPDWRGLWYNPTLGTIEGNSWNYSFASDSLLNNGHLGGTIHGVIWQSQAPYNQAPGVFDTAANVIWYYYDGVLSGINRNNGSTVNSVNLSGYNKSKVLRTALIYTGCAGKEIGLYENTKGMVILFSKTSGQAVDSIQLPMGSPTGVYLDGHFAYANSILWLFNSSIMKWIGFDLFSSVSLKEINSTEIAVYPNPSTSGNFNIHGLEKNTAVVIVNELGETVFYSPVNNTNETFNLSHLSKGIYFLQTQVNSTTISKKLIVQ